MCAFGQQRPFIKGVFRSEFPVRRTLPPPRSRCSDDRIRAMRSVTLGGWWNSMNFKLAPTLAWPVIVACASGCASTLSYVAEEEIAQAKTAMAERNFVRAKHRLEHVQSEGIREVDLLLGLVYVELGRRPQAIPLLRPFAEDGNQRTYGPIGLAYQMQSDYAEAEKWLRMASDLGDSRSKILLAIGHGAGWVIPSDRIAAFKLLDEAATDGEFAEIAARARKRVEFELKMVKGPARSEVPTKGCIVYFRRSMKYKESINTWCGDEADPQTSDLAKADLEAYVEASVSRSVGKWIIAEYIPLESGRSLNGVVHNAINERWVFTFSEGERFQSRSGSDPLRLN